MYKSSKVDVFILSLISVVSDGHRGGMQFMSNPSPSPGRKFY